MKPLPYLPLWLLLAACQSAPDTAASAACASPFEKTTLLVGAEVRHYVLAPHFRPRQKPCWDNLRTYLSSDGAPAGLDTGAHLVIYLDTTDFALPAGGSLGGAARQRVIAQQRYDKAAGVNEFTPDPNSTGRYPQAR